MVKISVIVPVYNVEDYIEETLDSILNQTIIDDMEVLLIDDGSTDNSRYIIEKYALDYDNFHAYHKENEGLPITRNYGLKLAKGEFVHFMDPDDYLPPEAYERLYDLSLKDNVDIVCGNVMRFATYNVWDSTLYVNSYKGIEEDIESTTFYNQPSLLWNTSACTKLFRREFLQKNNLEFINKKILYEDLLFSLESFILADSIAISKENFYYWRLRNKKTSITQQEDSFKNFHDRLEILRLSHQLFEKYNIDPDFINNLYLKWLNHDLMLFVTNISNFSKKYFKLLVDESKEILEYIPEELKINLNSYETIIYKMIENQDYDSLKSFSGVYDGWVEKPFVPDDLNEEYLQYIDFDRDNAEETFTVDVFDIDADEDNIIMDIEENFKFYSSDEPHEYAASLVDDDGNEYSIEIVENDKKQIIIPFDLVKDKDHLKIKIIYNYNGISKLCKFKYHARKSFEHDDYFVELGIGYNWKFHLNVVPKADNEIEITDITFEDDIFEFRGKYINKVDEVFIRNIIKFNEIEYSIKHLDNNEFTLRIPYSDILSALIKKWELNFRDSLNCIRVSKKFVFFKNNNKIVIKNARNKVLINNHLINVYDEIDSLNDRIDDLRDQRKQKNKKIKKLNGKIDKLNEKNQKLTDKNNNLKDKNQKLKDKNKLLNEIIDEYKSRKVVILADKLKGIKK